MTYPGLQFASVRRAFSASFLQPVSAHSRCLNDCKMERVPPSLLAGHHALVQTDYPWQQRARLLQGLWREGQRLPNGDHRGMPLGSRLAIPFAKDSLANYLTDQVRNVVRAEVCGTSRFKQP